MKLNHSTKPKQKSGTRTGQPESLTDQVQRTIVSALSAGQYIESAVSLAGIDKTTFVLWMKKGSTEREGIYHDFFVATRRALACAEMRYVDIISKCAHGHSSEGTWQAAAWMLEKFFAWTDGADTLEKRFNIDDLLTNVSVYWFSGNVGATLRMYQENSRAPLRFGPGERIRVPLSFARFPKEIVSPPREWVERVFDVARWTEMSAGGHFAALEQPEALAHDIHEAFGLYRNSNVDPGAPRIS